MFQAYLDVTGKTPRRAPPKKGELRAGINKFLDWVFGSRGHPDMGVAGRALGWQALHEGVAEVDAHMWALGLLTVPPLPGRLAGVALVRAPPSQRDSP